MKDKIIKCAIGIMKNETDPSVVVAFENGNKEKLFHFKATQLTLKENDFVGLTKVEAFILRSCKENIYLTK